MAVVFSTDPDWKKKENLKSQEVLPPEKQTAYIALDRKKRKGKNVTTVSKLNGDLKSLQRELQKACHSGGTLKNDIIEI